MYRFLLLFFFTGFSAFSQHKNSVKTNLVAGLTQIYSLQYERKLSENITFNNTFFFRPKNTIPFGDFIDDIAKEHGVGVTGIKFDYIYMDEAKLGLKGYSPELRWYMGKKQSRPFLGLFGMYEDFDMLVPALIPVSKDGRVLEVKLPINFTFNTLSGGLLLGYQFNWNRVGLDFVLVGPHFGRANDFYAAGENSAIQGLTDEEKDFLKEKVKERFGVTDKYFSLEVTDERAEIKSIRNIPYLGIRGFGLNLSYSF